MTSEVTREAPRPPADAYKLLEALLPVEWFLRRPPVKGTRLTIVGRDGIRTQWDFDPMTAERVSGLLSRRQTEARIIDRTAFDESDRA